MTRLTIRIDFDNGTALGPGKVRLLELIAETGSIRKAAVRMKMSYRRAWLLLKALDGMFRLPLVETTTGGTKGGGARLTISGAKVVHAYREIERSATSAAEGEISLLRSVLAQHISRNAAVRQKVAKAKVA